MIILSLLKLAPLLCVALVVLVIGALLWGGVFVVALLGLDQPGPAGVLLTLDRDL